MKRVFLVLLISLQCGFLLFSQDFEARTFPRPVFSSDNLEYGYRIAMDGDYAVVGTKNGELAEVLYNDAGTWSRIAILKASNRIGTDGFGQAVSIYGDIIVIGAAAHDTCGAAYIFEKPASGWQDMTETQMIVANDPGNNDNFGYSVRVHGNTVAVGAPMAKIDALSGRGAGYVFKKQDGVWTQKAKLTENSGTAWHRLGSSIAMATDTIILGADYRSEVFAYHKAAAGWSDMTQSQKLVFSDYSAADKEGYALSMSEGVLVVGAYKDDDATAGTDAGSVYVFQNVSGTWTEKAKLTSGDLAAYDYFGCEVDIENNVICVGALGNDNNSLYQNGSVYVFEKVAGAWTETKKLTAGVLSNNTYFGRGVAISGDYILGGSTFDLATARGAAHVMQKTGADWSAAAETQIIAPKGANNNIDYYYGYAVAIDKNSAVIGAPGANNNTGLAYVVEKINGTWDTLAILSGSDVGANAEFGKSVAISGDYIAVGAPSYNHGAVYIFKKPVTGWTHMTQTRKLIRSTGGQFGYSVAMSDSTLIVGDPNYATWTGQVSAYQCINGSWTDLGYLTSSSVVTGDAFGSCVAVNNNIACASAKGIETNERVLVFQYNGSSWVETDVLADGDSNDQDFFGYSVGISNNTICVGATYAPVGLNSNQGAAYIFEGGSGNFQLVKKITAGDGAANNYFGAVGISGDIITVGARVNGSNGEGAVYVYKRASGIWNENENSKLTYPGSTRMGFATAVNGGSLIIGSPSDMSLSSSAGCAYFYKVGEAPTAITLDIMNIDEDRPLNTPVIALSTTDINADETFSYSLVSGNGTNDADNAKFAVNGNNLQLTVPLDYETSATAMINLKVQDSEGLSYTEAFTLDVNNVTPLLSDTSVSIDENQAMGTMLVQVENGGDKTSVTYSLTEGNADNVFLIDSSTGRITVNDPAQLDYESVASYILKVQADDGANTSSAAVTVTVINLNDNRPVITAGGFSIFENPLNGSLVGIVQADDADELSALSYAIVSGTLKSSFAINVATGEITIADSSALDYETVTATDIEVSVSDGLFTESALFSVILNNINDNVPVVAPASSVEIIEDIAVGTVIDTIDASDADNDVLSYSIRSGNTGEVFYLDGISGILKTAGALDHATLSAYNLLIEISDGVHAVETTLHVSVIENVVNSVGENAEAEVKLYPNPAGDFVIIKGAEGMVRIFSLRGQLIKSVTEYGNDSRIDIGLLAPGMYIIEFADHRMKFVKE